MKGLVTQSCLTLYDPMDDSLPGSSVHGVLPARMLEWVAINNAATDVHGQPYYIEASGDSSLCSAVHQ